jgi:hypothetical protein
MLGHVSSRGALVLVTVRPVALARLSIAFWCTVAALRVPLELPRHPWFPD